MEKRPASHGNQAKIDPKKKIIGKYVTNAVTIATKKENETPLVDEGNVELAREFSKENKQ